MKRDWNILAQLTDRTVLGTDGLSSKAPQRKVRAILRNRDGKLALMYEKATGSHALPGGGIEPGEDETAALLRELLEETGCSCDTVTPLGIVTENRYHADTVRISYFFVVYTEQATAIPRFTAEEVALGTVLKWCFPEEALSLLRGDPADTPQRRFLQARDLAALLAYMESEKQPLT